ncbi:hypothetical protein ACP70R_028115 [Stipagrostis hirtigluma subsp. patula]
MFGFWQQTPTAGGAQPTFKIFCKADEGYCLAVRDGKVVLAAADSRDEHQHWFMDVRFSRHVKDEEGHPAFSLVNKATGLAVARSLGHGHPVKLLLFNPDYLDESVLWTESCDLGRDFGCIRMLSNINLTFDAFAGDGGAMRDGATVVLSEWADGDDGDDGQSWKILPWDEEADTTRGELDGEPTCRIYCKADDGLSVTARDDGGAVCLAPTDAGDLRQHWIQDRRYGDLVRDRDAYPAFALVNRATGEAIKGNPAFVRRDMATAGGMASEERPVKLTPYNPRYLDGAVLWTTSRDMGHGFRRIHMVDRITLNLDALHGEKDGGGGGGVRDGSRLVLSFWHEDDSQRWKIVPWCRQP